MSNLRKKLIRLAYHKPHLRGDLLPLIQKQAARSGPVGQASVKYNGKTYKAEVQMEYLPRGADPRTSNENFHFKALGRNFRIEWLNWGLTFVQMSEDPYKVTKSYWRIVVDDEAVGELTLFHKNGRFGARAKIGTQEVDMGWSNAGPIMGSAVLKAYLQEYGN